MNNHFIYEQRFTSVICNRLAAALLLALLRLAAVTLLLVYQYSNLEEQLTLCLLPRYSQGLMKQQSVTSVPMCVSR